jgi:hypothetical protein
VQTLVGQAPRPDDVVYAVRINRAAQLRLCEAAKISQVPDWRDDLFEAEPDLLEITRQLTGREFIEQVEPHEVLLREPYVGPVCGRTFALDEFRKAKDVARIASLPNPFNTRHPVHVSCPTDQ